MPIREISLDASSGEPPLPVYDTTGPYTDPAAEIDVEKGLPRTRIEWVKERGGIEEYEGRPIQPVDNGNVTGKHLARNFPNTPKPWRAVSSLHLPLEGGGRPAQPAGRGWTEDHPTPALRADPPPPGEGASTPSPNTNGRVPGSSPRK